MSRTSTVFMSVAMVAIAGTTLGLNVIAARRDTPQAVAAATAERARRFRQSGFEEAAKVSGSVGININAFAASPLSVYQLAAFSDVVVRGRQLKNRSVLLDARTIESDVTFQITERLKGGRDQDTVSARLQGGRVNFRDGSWAHVTVAGMTRPAFDREYLLFLRRTDGVLRPAFGMTGVYDITNLAEPAMPMGGWDSTFAQWLKAEQFTGARLVASVRDSVASSVK